MSKCQKGGFFGIGEVKQCKKDCKAEQNARQIAMEKGLEEKRAAEGKDKGIHKFLGFFSKHANRFKNMFNTDKEYKECIKIKCDTPTPTSTPNSPTMGGRRSRKRKHSKRSRFSKRTRASRRR